MSYETMHILFYTLGLIELSVLVLRTSTVCTLKDGEVFLRGKWVHARFSGKLKITEDMSGKMTSRKVRKYVSLPLKGIMEGSLE